MTLDATHSLRLSVNLQNVIQIVKKQKVLSVMSNAKGIIQNLQEFIFKFKILLKI